MAVNMEIMAGIVEQMNAFRMEGYHDAVIHVEEEKFYCHRHLMAAACPTLKPMLLEENWQTDTPRLKNVDSQLFKLIVEYVYSGVINITPDNALNLLKLADYLGMESLINTCIAFLKSSCPIEDLLEAYEFANHLQDANLIDILSTQVAVRLGLWRNKKKLLSFPFESVELILKKLKQVTESKGDSYLYCCDTPVASTVVQGTSSVCTNILKGPTCSHKTSVPLFVLNWIKENVAERIDRFSALCEYGDLRKHQIEGFNDFFQFLLTKNVTR